MLLAMALIWGVNYSVAKYGVRRLAPLAFNGLRVSLAAVALLALALLARRPWPTRRLVLTLLGLGVLGNCVYQVLFIEGIARTRAGTAALILGASPAFIAIIGRMRGIERTTRRALVGIILSIAGVALVLLAGDGGAAGQSTALGNALVLTGCLCWSAFTVFLEPYTHEVHPLQLSALTMAGGALPLLAVASPSLAQTTWSALPSVTWAAVGYSGIGALVIAYLFWYRGVRVFGPTRTAVYGNLQPVIALLFAWLVLGEVPTAWQAVGTAAIMGGIVLARSRRAPADVP
jgi:drug/metabolite transporter (DMT)-like permease